MNILSGINTISKSGIRFVASPDPPLTGLLVYLPFKSGDISSAHITNYATGTGVVDTGSSVTNTAAIDTSTFKVGNSSFHAGTASNVTSISMSTVAISNAFSVCFWVKVTGGTTNTRLFQLGAANYAVRMQGSANSFNMWCDLLSGAGLTVSNYSYVQGTADFLHIAWTCNCTSNSGGQKLYLNNVLQADQVGDAQSTVGNFSPIIVNGTDNNLTGYIDSFRLYNRVLTAAEVTAIYNARTEQF